jgi:hypothetical protein
MRTFVFAGLFAVVTILGGCGGSVGGQEQADKTALRLDDSGCPDLSGSYAFNVPGEGGVSYVGSILEELPVEDGNRVPAAQISGLIVTRRTHGLYDWHFLIDDTRVMQQLEVIREFHKPRYREWYHLLSGPARAAYIARNGDIAYAKRLAELGPRSEIVRTLRVGTDMACRDGWLELPRAYSKPIRLTLGEDGSIIGESREISTVGVAVWCGDGCKDLPIPTGTFTGSLQWPRSDGRHAWRPDEMIGRYDFPRPVDEIEAEKAAFEANRVREDAKRYAPAETIRERLALLVPVGTVLDGVAVRNGKVHIRYTAPVAQADWLLDKVEQAGGDRRGPEDVVRSVTSGRPEVTEVEFTLTDSPLVAPDVAAARPAPESTPTLAVLSVAPPEPAPAGIADATTIRRRTGALFPAGTRIIDVRYGGDNVTIVGEADSNRSVSDGLRAIDGEGSAPELLRIETRSAGKVRFEILLRRSALVEN